MEIVDLIKKKVKEAVKETYQLDIEDVFVEHPENEEFGDFSTNVALGLAKMVKQSPIEIAKKLVYELQLKNTSSPHNGEELQIFSSVEFAPPGFINFKLSLQWLQKVPMDINKPNLGYEIGDISGNIRIALEHSNVNPNKAAHIGHLRNACIGQFLERAYEKLGHKVEVQYYCNDLGLQVATSQFGTEKLTEIKSDDYKKFDHYMWDVYSKISSQLDEDNQLKEELNSRLVQLTDPESEQFKKQKDLAKVILKDNLDTFSKLDFDYDVVVFESDIEGLHLWDKTFEVLKQNPNFYLASDGPSKGCWLIKLSEKDETTLLKDGTVIEEDKIIVRSNGVPTYTGKDIAYHMWKYGLLGLDFHYDKFTTTTQQKDLWATTSQPHKDNESLSFSNVNKVFDVIDIKQTYAINVVKQSLKYLGYEEQAVNMNHINYGFVYLSPKTAEMLGVDISDGKSRYGMSGRKGWGIKIDDFIEMVDKKLIGEYGMFPALKDVRNGAIKFEMLKYNTYQDLVFDLNAALSIKGYSGPYIQYTHARANSVITKYGSTSMPEVYLESLDPKEISILRALYKFPEVVERSAQEFAPNIMCNYLFDLCQRFNLFYNDISILNSENEAEKKFRVSLTYSVKTVIKEGLEILGISATEKM